MAAGLIPSEGFPLRDINEPVLTAGYYRERVSLRNNYAPVARGTLYSTTEKANADVVALFPSLYLLKETKAQGSDEWVIREWATDEAAADTFNAEITYSGESLSAPVYARVYRVRRDTYEASPSLTYGTALTGLIGIKPTAGGTGYRSTDTVNIAGGGAAAQLVVNGSGTIISVVVTVTGSGYDSAALPAVTITTLTGSGATLVAIVQPKTAVLVSQKKQEYPQDSPFRAEFVQVLRVYETLPGPAITGATQNGNGSAGTITKQTVAAGTATPTGADVLESEVTPINAVKSELNSRTGALWSNTTGLTHGPLGIPGTITDAVVDKTTAAISTGIDIGSSDSNPEDALRNHQRTVTVPFSTTTINSKENDNRGYVPAIVQTFVAPNSTPPAESHLVHVERRMDTKDRTAQRVLTFSNGRPLLRKRYNRFGGLDVATDSYVAPATVPANSTWTVEELLQEQEMEARLISTVIAAGVAIATVEKVGNVPGARATIEMYLVLASTSIPDDTTVITYERLEYPENPLLRIEKKTTYTIPADYPETRNQGYYMPTLFESYYSDNIQGTTLFNRGGFTVNVPHRVVHHFSTTRGTPAAYPIIEDELLVFSIPVRGLTDGVTFNRTVDGVLYTQTRPATSPTKTTYIGLIGTEVIATGDSTIYRAGIYDTITAYVTLQ